MRIGESQGLDLQKLGLAQQAVCVDAQSVGGQSGVKPGTQDPRKWLLKVLMCHVGRSILRGAKQLHPGGRDPSVAKDAPSG